MPILLVLVAGVLDAGRGVLAATSLNGAVREAARYAAVHYPMTGWDSGASARASATAVGLTAADLTVTVSTVVQSGDTYVSVSGSYEFRAVAPGVTAIAGTIPLRAGARMLAKA
jgi:Flp pilus assembly protein TadG